MSEVVVYHGGTKPIATPICRFGRPNLDFGQGFYVTNLREQAVTWANNMALRELSKHQPNNQMCILNQEIISKYFVYDGTESL